MPLIIQAKTNINTNTNINIFITLIDIFFVLNFNEKKTNFNVLEGEMKNREEVPISEVRENLSDLINKSAFGKQRIILNRRGKCLVALVPIEDVEALEKQEEEREKKLCEK